jgi:hypothetical protein
MEELKEGGQRRGHWVFAAGFLICSTRAQYGHSGWLSRAGEMHPPRFPGEGPVTRVTGNKTKVVARCRTIPDLFFTVPVRRGIYSQSRGGAVPTGLSVFANVMAPSYPDIESIQQRWSFLSESRRPRNVGAILLNVEHSADFALKRLLIIRKACRLSTDRHVPIHPRMFVANITWAVSENCQAKGWCA